MQWFRGGTAHEVILVRLDAGEDLRDSLARVAEELSLGVGVVLSGQGILSRARLAGAGEVVVEKPGPLRIVSLQGTLFGGSVDLTLTLARSGGVFAGVVPEGCLVEESVECALLRVGQLNPVRLPGAGGAPRLQAAAPVRTTGERITLMGQPVDPSVLDLVPRHLIQRYRVLPIHRTGRTLVVAMSDIGNIIAIDDLRLATGLQIQPVAVPFEELQAAIARLLPRAP